MTGRLFDRPRRIRPAECFHGFRFHSLWGGFSGQDQGHTGARASWWRWSNKLDGKSRRQTPDHDPTDFVPDRDRGGVAAWDSGDPGVARLARLCPASKSSRRNCGPSRTRWCSIPASIFIICRSSISGIHEIVHAGRSETKKGWLLPAAMITAAALIAGAIWWAMSRSNVQSVTTAATTPAPRSTESAVPRATATKAPVVPAPSTASAPAVTPTIATTAPSPTAAAAQIMSLPILNFTRIAPRVPTSSRTMINDRFQSATAG